MDKNKKNNQMGSDSCDKTPNGDSAPADDNSHATNEDLEGINLIISLKTTFLKQYFFSRI